MLVLGVEVRPGLVLVVERLLTRSHGWICGLCAVFFFFLFVAARNSTHLSFYRFQGQEVTEASAQGLPWLH